MNIYEKLLNIQSELKAPKSQYNSFGKYAYRNCEDILEAVKPLCVKNKAVLVVSDEIEAVGERYYVKATATLYDTESVDKIAVTSRAREEESKKGMDGSQVTGASSSYARKYALNGLFDIDDTKDSDATNNEDKSAPKQPTTVSKQAQAISKQAQAISKQAQAAVTYEQAVKLKVKDGRTLAELKPEELAKIMECNNQLYSDAAKLIVTKQMEEEPGELPFA